MCSANPEKQCVSSLNLILFKDGQEPNWIPVSHPALQVTCGTLVAFISSDAEDPSTFLIQKKMKV